MVEKLKKGKMIELKDSAGGSNPIWDKMPRSYQSKWKTYSLQVPPSLDHLEVEQVFGLTREAVKIVPGIHTHRLSDYNWAVPTQEGIMVARPPTSFFICLDEQNHMYPVEMTSYNAEHIPLDKTSDAVEMLFNYLSELVRESVSKVAGTTLPDFLEDLRKRISNRLSRRERVEEYLKSISESDVKDQNMESGSEVDTQCLISKNQPIYSLEAIAVDKATKLIMNEEGPFGFLEAFLFIKNNRKNLNFDVVKRLLDVWKEENPSYIHHLTVKRDIETFEKLIGQWRIGEDPLIVMDRTDVYRGDVYVDIRSCFDKPAYSLKKEKVYAVPVSEVCPDSSIVIYGGCYGYMEAHPQHDMLVFSPTAIYACKKDVFGKTYAFLDDDVAFKEALSKLIITISQIHGSKTDAMLKVLENFLLNEK